MPRKHRINLSKKKDTHCKWMIILMFALFTVILLLHPFNFTCSMYNRDMISFCTPQFSFKFLNTAQPTSILLGVVGESIQLLSYLATDLGWESNLMKTENSNISNIFQLDIIYRVNFDGYCKLHPNTTESILQSYCAPADRPFNILSLFAQDIGYQFGLLSHSDVKQMSKLFLALFHTCIDTLLNLSISNQLSNLVRGLKFTITETSMLKIIQNIRNIHLFDELIGVLSSYRYLEIWIDIAIFFSMCFTILVWRMYLSGFLTSDISFYNSFDRFTNFFLVLVMTSVFISNIFHLLLLIYFWKLSSIRYPNSKSIRVISFNLDTGYLINVIKNILRCIHAFCCFRWIHWEKALNMTLNTEELLELLTLDAHVSSINVNG